jgi:hypothetical protein
VPVFVARLCFVWSIVAGAACGSPGGPPDAATDAGSARDATMDAGQSIDAGIDAGVRDAGVVDAGVMDASTDAGFDASTCGNGVEDPGERCCTDADRTAFLAALAPDDIATRVCCVEQSQDGDLGGAGTGVRWCTSTEAACGDPACVVSASASAWSASSTGGEETLDVVFPVDVPVALSGLVVGLPVTCTATVRGSFRSTLRFDLTDSGTHLGVSLRRSTVSENTVVCSIPPCGFDAFASTIANHFVSSIHLQIEDELVAATHACEL